MRIQLAFLLLIPLVVALAGCEAQSAARAAIDARAAEQIPFGTDCLVQLQRNALGAGSSTPISATLQQINGAVLSLRGKLKQMNSDWVVLTLDDKSECWIAKSAVLTITIPPAGQSR